MLNFIIPLLAVPALCVFWLLFQQWLAKKDPQYRGYQAGCGSCGRDCHSDSEVLSSSCKSSDIKYIDATALIKKS